MHAVRGKLRRRFALQWLDYTSLTLSRNANLPIGAFVFRIFAFVGARYIVPGKHALLVAPRQPRTRRAPLLTLCEEPGHAVEESLFVCLPRRIRI